MVWYPLERFTCESALKNTYHLCGWSALVFVSVRSIWNERFRFAFFGKWIFVFFLYLIPLYSRLLFLPMSSLFCTRNDTLDRYSCEPLILFTHQRISNYMYLSESIIYIYGHLMNNFNIIHLSFWSKKHVGQFMLKCVCVIELCSP